MPLRAKKTPRACKSVLTKTLKQRVLAMCLLCDDEKAYQAYMNYLDAMEREGKTADPDKAIDAVLDALEAAGKASDEASRDNPANDKTLSAFFCSEVDK